MSSKNEMFVFGLRSTSDDQPSDLSNECRPKCKKIKKGPISHQKIKCLFLDYVQLLMIGQAIQYLPPTKQKNFDFLKVHF